MVKYHAVHDTVIDPKLMFFTDEEAWFHLSGYSNAQTVRTRGVLI
jgi:hypothetical protein